MADPDNPVPPQEPIPWWASPTLRYAAIAAAPGIVLGLRALGWVTITNDQAADLVLSVVAGGALVGIVIRRIKAGKDPASPAPPIKMRVL